MKSFVTVNFLVSIAALFFQGNLFANNDTSPVVVGHSFKFHSELLNETRVISVSLPSNYHSEMYFPKNYPVLYALDGEWHFQTTNSVVKELSEKDIQAIPEMIVVSVHNTHRDRDMTPTHSKVNFFGEVDSLYNQSGGAKAFLSFLTEELKPYINQQYRTSGFDLLAGHSLAGLLTLYSVIETPDEFDGQIVIDPSYWWDNEFIIKKMQRFTKEHKNKLNLVIATARFERTKTLATPHKPMLQAKKLDQIFETSNNPDWDYKRFHFTNESHASVPMIGLYSALKHLFRGHALSSRSQFDHPEDIPAQFKQLSERLGSRFYPSEGYIDGLGCLHLNAKDTQRVDTALAFFKINTENYPESYHAWHSLGEAYLAKQQYKQAKSAFNRSLALNPDWSFAKSRLTEIEQVSR